MPAKHTTTVQIELPLWLELNTLMRLKRLKMSAVLHLALQDYIKRETDSRAVSASFEVERVQLLAACGGDLALVGLKRAKRKKARANTTPASQEERDHL